MGEVIVFVDTVLVPLSLFITIGYHVILWYNFKHNPSSTSIGLDALRRKLWFQEIKQGDDKKGTLAVQSMRNMLMVTILSASISILINLSLAALTNNAYNASNLLNSNSTETQMFFGSQNPFIFVVKYGSTSMILTTSFICSSLAVGFLVDANFLVNVGCGEEGFGDCGLDSERADPYWVGPAREYTRWVMERGFVVGIMGNRILCVAFPLVFWMFGPWIVFFSSLGLVWVLYQFDFVTNFKTL